MAEKEQDVKLIMEKINDNNYFKDQGIKIYEKMLFSKNNIIVGENGSGKTRFLKRVREYYLDKLSVDSEKIVYAYFPDLSGSDKVEAYDMQESLFLKFLYKQNRTFENFIRCIESDGVKFIRNLFNIENNLYSGVKARCLSGREELNIKLKLLTGYSIEEEQFSIYLKKGTDKQEISTCIYRMSPGERTLFYLSLYILFLQEIWGDNSDFIIILDEPELHLHTKALINFIEELKKQIKYNQLWIATHSYALTAQFEFEELICIKDGEIKKRTSDLYEDIYVSLMGTQDNRLHDFLVNIEKCKYYDFIAECFAEPKVVSKIDSEDKQFQEFLEMISMLRGIAKMKVLDFGAGEERIKKCMEQYAEESTDKKRKDIESVEIYGYDRMWKKESLNKYRFNDLGEMKRRGIKFDCIVMMNVLHEIDINEWLSNLKDIAELLEETGRLFLVEVETLTNGEQPYGDSGFLILYESQIKCLFKSDEIKRVCKDGRIKKSNAFLLTKKHVKQVSKESIRAALELLRDQTWKELEELNKLRIEIAHKDVSKEETKKIRRYAYLSQLHLNSIFALQLLAV